MFFFAGGYKQRVNNAFTDLVVQSFRGGPLGSLGLKTKGDKVAE